TTFLAIGIFSFYIGFLFQGMLVMFIQSFMPGRVIGMLVSAAVLFGLIFLVRQLPFYHPLMSYGSVGAGAYSEMAGFSRVEGFGWEFLYWAGLILILGALSVWVWRRGMQDKLSIRLSNMRSRMSLPSIGTAVLGVLLFAGFGYAGLQSYRAGDYMNSDQQQARSAEFERTVGDLWMNKEPRVTDVSVRADFFPDSQTARFDGRYTIDNPWDEPVGRTTVYAGVGLDNLSDLAIEGASPVEGEDVADRLRDDYDVLVVEFDPPLQPGESREVSFTTRFEGPTLTSGSSVARNGTFVNNNDALIIFGNLNQGFLTNPDTRRQQDLPERMRWPDRDDVDARRKHLLTSFSGFADYVDFDAEVCTIESQIPVAPGKFRGETVEDGRRCRSYRSINPILNFFSFLTAEYEVRTDVWEGNGQRVDLEIYFHPAHDYNIDIMFEAMKVSMETYTDVFTPYQYAQLRIMEFPFNSFAQAFAGTVPFAETIGFVQDPGNAEDPDQVDFASYVTMHEIGHQWFAHQVVGAFAKGSNLLSEGLTEYATMLAYERKYDFPKARRMHEERPARQYLAMRTFERDDEPVLAEAEGQQYLNYNKASWVFWGMRGLIGEEPVLRAVRRFLVEHHADNGAPYPTTLELVALLKEEAGPDYDLLIEDYWNRITFWDLSFQNEADVTVTPAGNGFDVTIPLAIDKKYASEEDGKETSWTEIEDARLDEWVEIGFYTEDPEPNLGATPMHTEIVRVSEAEQSVTVRVGERPTHIVLDPARRLIERNVNDNSQEIDAPSES
ncbi:MAG: M1 family aminopeptidase, partial [Litorimonas sp.]